MNEMHAIVSGRVQMVMMRDFVQRKARGLGLVGYVKNLPDKTVEVVAQGSRDGLVKLEAELHKGPLLARVERVEVDWRALTGSYEGFSIDLGN